MSQWPIPPRSSAPLLVALSEELRPHERPLGQPALRREGDRPVDVRGRGAAAGLCCVVGVLAAGAAGGEDRSDGRAEAPIGENCLAAARSRLSVMSNRRALHGYSKVG